MKKKIYIILTTFLGILLGSLLIGLIERWVINSSLSQGILPQPYFYVNQYGYIPPYLSISILILSLISGFLIGHKWWNIVYIKNKHWQKKNKKLR